MTDKMGRGGYAVFLVAVLGFQAVLLLAPGGLYVNGHEGDLLHTLEAATRIAEGEWPHLDFMTPLGLFTFAPIGLLMAVGLAPGQALLASYVLVAACLLPGIWHLGNSRMGPRLRLFFGVWVVFLITALVYGGDEPTISISMYYNRWAWALTALIALTILLPPKGEGATPRADGVLIGLCMAALLLIKLTYFISLAPAVLVYFIVQRAGRAFMAALLSALVVALLVTLLVGDLWFWGRYLGDLLFVAGSDTRPKPGLEFSGIVANPKNLPATVGLLISVAVLRLGGRAQAGLILLLLAPGFFYITYQNWGNDPQWLMIQVFALLALCPASGVASIRGFDARNLVLILTLVAATVATPSVINIAFSTIRGALLDHDKYVLALPGTIYRDVYIAYDRSFDPVGQIDLPAIDAPVAPDADGKTEEDAAVVVNGEILQKCEAFSALVGTLRHIGAELSGMPQLQGASLLSADILNSYWMVAPVKRLPGAAPWYYGGRPGFAQVEYLLVPLCPVSPKAREVVLSIVAEDEWDLQEIRRTPHFILYRRAR